MCFRFRSLITTSSQNLRSKETDFAVQQEESFRGHTVTAVSQAGKGSVLMQPTELPWRLTTAVITRGSKDTAQAVEADRRSWAGISIVLVAASLAIRLAALRYWGIGPIENEGAEYARIAENLRNGAGLVGIAAPGTELLFNPLYPLLIAAVSFLTHDYEWAARLISLISGSFLPLAALGIASRLFSRRVGIVAALLTATYPLLVNLSFTAYSEGNYATLLLFAVYLVLRALNHGSLKLWSLAGAAFGLAYLLRAEATAPLAISAVFAFVMRAEKAAYRYKRTAAAILGFLVMALPEVILIYKSTGKVLLDGKSPIFYALGTRTLAPNFSFGRGYDDLLNRASYSVQADLRRTGVFMRPSAEVIREVRLKAREFVRLLETGTRYKAPALLRTLASEWFGAPFVPALALLGALRRPWRRPNAGSRLFFMLVTAAPAVATFTFLWSEPRHYFVFVACLLIWAANGLIEVGRWTLTTIAPLWSGRAIVPILSSWVVSGMLALATVVYPIKGVRTCTSFADSAPDNRVERDVGVWIGRRQAHHARIMDLPLTVAYHAGADHVYFPYCDGETALRFLDAAQVDYVVLRRDRRFTQYYEDWLTYGIPDSRAESVDVSSIAGTQKFVVFRWHRN